MKRKPPRARLVTLGALIVAFAVSATIWNLAFRPPSINLRPLPPQLIGVDSAAGQDPLAGNGFVVVRDGR